MWKEVVALIKKDLTLDFRQRYAIFATLLYVVSTTYIAYLIFRDINDRQTWVALYWIITIFAAITSSTRSFSAESQHRFWYYAQLVRPNAVILSKLLYNVVQMLIISLFTFGLFRLLLGDPIADDGQMLLFVLLGAVGFSTTLTLMSAIASKTNNNTTLMAILSIPLLLPLAATLIAGSKKAALGTPFEESLSFFGVLLLLNILTGVLSVVLYPYMWRE
ncbi:heme exporter protein CcmB [Phaeocystidibacter luteus]|uniref:ABC transporter permease n=1 Tax=Phaeocystidibacter luteus TaxID=911197 RepID=A0A6N6RD92_9FLAO|nr:heme exporter protein CcmB [Phaeocystidibacter luteus]KAB2805454.1 ABC transporter permease [Phaeocystidibacter luteus]